MQSANDPFAPIARQRLSDQVYDRLRGMIVSGQLGPGDTVPSERVLMERFGVGRPAVREAMQALANKGLITISQGERSRVNAPTADIAIGQVDEIAKMLLSSEPANLGHLKQLRKILETGTVALAARHCGEGDAQALRDLVEVQRAAVGDPEGFVAADIAFHVAIAGLTGNPLLQTVTGAMLTWLRDYYAPLLRWSGREATTLVEHARLVDHLAAGNAEAAVAMMTAHLDRSDPLYTAEARS
ncbi:transcriptional regulator NanR [Mesobacterium pallidum]|uniref:transcriptional regulator NanR n=1 Tax=Mesobacterium pallidum TaxID=2872037 RepID=UPI001EE25386|nr:transcriptional regulator NanR [Mesobacterium pallidum]